MHTLYQAATGTLALTSQIPSLTGYVPYTGATGAVNLGAYDLTVNGLTVGLGGNSVARNTAIGNLVLATATGNNNTAVGFQAGLSISTGYSNSLLEYNAGYFITSGNGHSILGRFNGNQNNLDLRTNSNYIVLSDGDGNPRQIIDVMGRVLVGSTAAIQSLDLHQNVYNHMVQEQMQDIQVVHREIKFLVLHNR